MRKPAELFGSEMNPEGDQYNIVYWRGAVRAWRVRVVQLCGESGKQKVPVLTLDSLEEDMMRTISARAIIIFQSDESPPSPLPSLFIFLGK